MTEAAPLKSFASNRRAAECAARARGTFSTHSYFQYPAAPGPRTCSFGPRVASNAFRHLNPDAWASSPIAFVSETPPEKCSAFCRPSPRTSQRSAHRPALTTDGVSDRSAPPLGASSSSTSSAVSSASPSTAPSKIMK